MELKATYYNGARREGQPATVELLSENIKIQPHGEGYLAPVYWNATQVQNIRHHKPGAVLLQNTLNTKEYLEISKEDFEHHIAPFYAGRPLTTQAEEKTGSALKPVLIICTIIVAVFALFYWVVMPLVAEGFAKVVPKETEVSIGQTLFEHTVSDYTVNDSATKIANEFFSKISRPQDYTIKITVVKENQVNAFAMPGGNIVVFDGIIKEMDAYPQLAALLSHEFSHVQYRHTTRSIFRSLANYLFISIVIGDAGSVAGVIAEHTNQLKDLSYSRGLEKEADMKGLEILTQNTIDPNGILQLFDWLEKAAGSQQVPEFLSSHPVTNNRKEYVQEKIAAGNYTVKENPELKALFDALKGAVK